MNSKAGSPTSYLYGVSALLLFSALGPSDVGPEQVISKVPPIANAQLSSLRELTFLDTNPQTMST